MRGRPAKWNGETEVVRLPKHAISACLELAKVLDQPLPEVTANTEFEAYQSFVQKSLEPTLVTINSTQYVVRCDSPISFEDWKLLERLEADVLKQCQKKRLNPLAVVARLTEEIYR